MSKKGIGNPAAIVGASILNDPWTKRLLVGGAIVGGGVLIHKATSFYGSLFEMLGLKDSKEDKEEEELVNAASNYPQFDPNFWKKNKDAYVFGLAAAKAKAATIKDAFGAINDDEEKIYDRL